MFINTLLLCRLTHHDTKVLIMPSVTSVLFSLLCNEFVMKQAECFETGDLSAQSNTHAPTVSLDITNRRHLLNNILGTRKQNINLGFMAFINRNVDI